MQRHTVRPARFGSSAQRVACQRQIDHTTGSLVRYGSLSIVGVAALTKGDAQQPVTSQ